MEASKSDEGTALEDARELLRRYTTGERRF